MYQIIIYYYLHSERKGKEAHYTWRRNTSWHAARRWKALAISLTLVQVTLSEFAWDWRNRMISILLHFQNDRKTRKKLQISESDLAKFSALLGFSPFFYVFPPIDEETLYARAPRVSARADGTNRPGARRWARTPSFRRVVKRMEFEFDDMVNDQNLVMGHIWPI